MPPLPWFKYYPNDFFNDPNVARMTLEEIGMYHLMLQRAWNEHPPGSLPASLRELSALLGQNFRKTSRLVSGTLARCWYESEGRLWNPRLVKEAEIQQAISEGGRKGAKQTNTAYAVAKANAPPVGNQIQNQKDQDQKPTPPYNPPPGGNGDGLREEFEILWKQHPDKQGRSKKEPSWKRYKEARKKASAEEILSCHARFMKCRDWTKNNREFVPGLQVWLKSKPWKGTKLETTDESWQRIIDEVEGRHGGD